MTDYIFTLARAPLARRFTMCLAQTTKASRLWFALGRHFMPREREKNWKFSIFRFLKFCTVMMT